MPAGKELGRYDAKITSIRVEEIDGDHRVISGTYEAEISGQMAGMATGTMTFHGSNESGTLSDLGVGYLNTGEALSAKGQGVYWLTQPGHWEVRAAYTVGDQRIVSEGQIDLAKRALTGTMVELN